MGVYEYRHCPEVWVDDDYTHHGYNDGRWWGCNAFNNIEIAYETALFTGSVSLHINPGRYYANLEIPGGVDFYLNGSGADETIIDGGIGHGPVLEKVLGDSHAL